MLLGLIIALPHSMAQAVLSPVANLPGGTPPHLQHRGPPFIYTDCLQAWHLEGCSLSLVHPNQKMQGSPARGR